MPDRPGLALDVEQQGGRDVVGAGLRRTTRGCCPGAPAKRPRAASAEPAARTRRTPRARRCRSRSRARCRAPATRDAAPPGSARGYARWRRRAGPRGGRASDRRGSRWVGCDLTSTPRSSTCTRVRIPLGSQFLNDSADALEKFGSGDASRGPRCLPGGMSGSVCRRPALPRCDAPRARRCTPPRASPALPRQSSRPLA